MCSSDLTSGIRVGTPAVTTRGLKEPQMRKIADFINGAIEANNDAAKLKAIQGEVLTLTKKFPMYPELSRQK